MKRLYISDLDGTLLSSSGSLSDFSASVLNKLISDGIHFSIATARSLPSLLRLDFTDKINFFNDPLAIMNGVAIQGIKWKNHPPFTRTEGISLETALEIAEKYDSMGVKGHIYRYVSGLPVSYSNALEKGYIYCESVRELVMQSRENLPIYFTATDYRQKLQSFRDAVSSIKGVGCTFYEDVYTGMYYLEVFSENASKAGALRFFRSEYGFDEIVCFGDNFNDIAMFREADVKIAVGNAKDELKEKADFVIDTNDNDGVAKWLLENIQL